MKVIIEVVATNTNSGQIAINQKEVEIGQDMPYTMREKLAKKMMADWEESDESSKKTIFGEIMISRNMSIIY